MKAEILFPDLINLYGELWNGKIIKTILKENCYFTNYDQQPHFIDESIDLIYIGPTSENKQLIILDKLKHYRERLVELIENGTIFLCVGNGGDYFGQYIITDNYIKTNCLNIFDYYTKIDFKTRHNSMFLGVDHQNLEYVGFKSQFGLLQNVKSEDTWIKTRRGYGNNINEVGEGFKYKNFYLTNIIGPFLIMNPYFLIKLFDLKNYCIDKNILSNMILAYEQRLKEFKDPKTKND